MTLVIATEDLVACKGITMVKRIITGVCLIATVIPVLIFSYTWIFPLVISLISVVCLYEMVRCMGMHKNIAMTMPLYLCAAAFPFLLRFYENDFYVAGMAAIAIISYVAYVFVWVIFSKGTIEYTDACTMCLTAFYIIFALNMIVYIRDYPDGQYMYILILVGAWVTDTFAYFTGRLFGKHKLAPDVSPKKTVEGAIGGVVFCSVGFVVTGLIIDAFFDGVSPNYLYLAISGLLVGIISQSGDLIMSVIKRHYGIKDYGNILPGHGGMLDRVDSMLAVAFGVDGLLLFSYLTHITLF